MRFARAQVEAEIYEAVVHEDELVRLPNGATIGQTLPRGLEALLDVGRDAIRRRDASVSVAAAKLLPPIEPRSVRDFNTFERHKVGYLKSIGQDGSVPAEWYEMPAFYFSHAGAVVGPTDDVEVPPACREFDFELEVAAVIGGPGGRDFDANGAASAIVGYTIMNDWSARDLQRREMRVGLGPVKGKDGATTLGPVLVTADELAPHLEDGFLNLATTAHVGERELGSDSLVQMSWSFPELVVYASRGAWVLPGDVLGSGTCANGCLADLRGQEGPEAWPWLAPGDLVTLSVEGIGSISNRVVPSQAPIRHLPSARRRA